MKNKKNILGLMFVFLLSLVIVVTCFVMPKSNVYAYRSGYNNAVATKYGTAIVKVVDADTEEEISDAKFSITTQRYDESGSLFTDNDSGISSSVTIGQINIGNTYLDRSVGDNVFSYENENVAIITLTEDSTPSGYKSLTGPVVLKYFYENTNHLPAPGTDYFDHNIDNESYQPTYELDVEVLQNPNNAVEKTTERIDYSGGTDLTYTLTIKYKKATEPDPEPVIIDPPVSKVVNGDTPSTRGTFTFVMKAISNTAGYSVDNMPMPEGATNGEIRKTVSGPGSYEFGEYEITKVGQYVYELAEENKGEEGYTYDTTTYTITRDITNVDNKLVATCTIKDGNNNIVDKVEFKNTYKNKTPSKPIEQRPVVNTSSN